MRVIMFLLYLFVFWLDCGNNCYSTLQYSPIQHTSNAVIGKQYFVAYIRNAEVIDFVQEGLPDLIEEDFTELVEENSTEGNEENNTKVFSKKHNLQQSWALNAPATFHITHRFSASKFILPGFIASLPVVSDAAPIYLTNRVFRI